jgi:hypothetical protein
MQKMSENIINMSGSLFYCIEYSFIVKRNIYYLNGEQIIAKDNDEFLRIVKLKVFM